jgi:predicted amidohydrolase YtcJ
MTVRRICLLLLLSACARPTTPAAGQAESSTLYVNGRIYTLDGGKIAAAMRVSGPSVTAVWDTAPTAMAGERVVDLGGASVVPGLTDAHGHLDMLGRQMSQLDLRDAKSPEEVAALVRERAATIPAGGWVIGFGWDQNLWTGKAFPNRAVLDAAAPGHKVWLRRISHAVWVNTAVLTAAGVDKTSKSPQGGDILHDAKGEPTGVLVDTAAELVAPLLPTPTMEERREQLTRAMERVMSYGMTGVHTMSLSIAYAEALHQLEAEGRVPMRVGGYITDEWPAVEAFIKQPPDREGMVQIVGVKLYADGALGSRSAALLAPYSDDAKSRGLTIYDTPTLRDHAGAIIAAGYQIAVHAIGDAANRQALDVLTPFVAAAKLTPRIEHVQIIEHGDLMRFASSGIIASVQPIHAPSDMRWAVERVGWDRLNGGSYAARELIESGATVLLGSDFPIESANPWWGIHAAVTRQNSQGEPAEGFLPKQKLSLAEALEHYCVTPHQVLREDHPGVLRDGAPADFVVVDRDPFAIAPSELRDVKALRTVIAGREVFSAGGAKTP